MVNNELFISKKKMNELGIKLPGLKPRNIQEEYKEEDYYRELLLRQISMYMLKNVTIYWYCDTFLSDRSLISIEYVDSNDTIFEGTVEELKDTIDADLRLICNTITVKKAIPTLCLRKGTPLSTCLMI